MVKRINFTGNEQEDIKRMCACKEFVEDLKLIGLMKEQYSKPKDI